MKKLILLLFIIPIIVKGQVVNIDATDTIIDCDVALIDLDKYYDCYNDSAVKLFTYWTDEDATLKGNVSQFYDSIQEYHIDDTLDFLYNFAVHNTAAAVYDWIRMGITATLVNSPVHTAYEGFLTDGASSYGKINYNPGTDAVHWRLNSASFGVYIRTNDYTTVKWLIGMGDASNVADIYFLSSTKFRFRINNNGAVYEDVVHENDISGFTILTRQNATTGAYARNSDTYSTISINSSGIPNQALGIFVGAYNNNGSVGYYSPNQFSFAFGGGQLTETQATKLYEAMERFLDAYGTGVN